MNSSIDTLLKISAPAAKPAPTGPAHDDASQFDNYLRQAAKTTTAPEPTTKPQPTARPAKEESDTVATGEQDAAASSDDETVPTEVTEQAEVSPEESTDVVEADELLVSAAAAAIVAQQPEAVPVIEILTGELTAEPSAEVPTTVQAEPNAEGSIPTANQKTPATAAQTGVAELLPVAASDATTIPSEQVAANLVPAQSSAQSLGEDAEVTVQDSVPDESHPSPVKGSAQGASVAALAAANKPHDDRGESSPSEQDSQEAPVVEVRIEIPQPAVTERAELVTDSDKSTGGNEKASNVASSSSTTNSHLGNQAASQTVGAVSRNTDAHATRAEGESQTPTIDRARFVQRVTNAFRAAQQNDGHIQLRLSPPELGQLRIEIAVRNGVLSANLETETADARRVLLDNLPALRQRLAEQDIRIDKFEVDIRREGGQPDGQAGAQERQTEQQSQRASAQNRIRTTQTSEIITTRVPRTQAMSADAGLDVRI